MTMIVQHACPRFKSYIKLHILKLAIFLQFTFNMLNTQFPISIGTNKQSEKLTLRLRLLCITRFICICVFPASINVCMFL